MVKKISKKETEEKIKEFFSHIRHKTPEEVKKIKSLAMKRNIKLGDKRKLFCKNCLNPYVNSSINIKDGFINIICEKCKFKNRWKAKNLNFGINYNPNDFGCC
jgi:RNase P subunit RPR2